jgi:hypothetical protein
MSRWAQLLRVAWISRIHRLYAAPPALMLVGILHFLEDKDEPERIIATLLDALSPGYAPILSAGSRSRHVTPASSPRSCSATCS